MIDESPHVQFAVPGHEGLSTGQGRARIGLSVTFTGRLTEPMAFRG